MKFEDALNFIRETKNKNYVVLINGKKHNLRLFTNGDLIGEYGKGMRNRGFGVSPLRVMEWESITTPKTKPVAEKLRKTITTAVKYLSASGLWKSIRTSMEFLLSLNDEELTKIYEMCMTSSNDYRKFCEDNDLHITADELWSLANKPLKTINYHSWEKEQIRERFAKSIAEKTEYRHRWEKGYDNSIECGARGDDMCAWYSEEYRGCGNGHYYLALDARHALFVEND